MIITRRWLEEFINISSINTDEICRTLNSIGLEVDSVDQNVFDAVGYENKSGYAFGLGIERFAMLIHSIGDLRSLFESDTRLLGQFK